MSLVVVGSVALDTVETPFGRAEAVLGGSGTYFSAAASLFHPVRLVGVIGDDYPVDELGFLQARGVDMEGLERASGPSFHWVGRYDFDLNTAHTIDTRLGVFADFKPQLPASYRDAEWVFLANIDPELQLEVLDQVSNPRLVACDTMNFWIQGKKDALLRLLERIDLMLLNEAEIRQLTGKANLLRGAREVMARGPKAVVVKKGEHGAMLFTNEGVFFVPGYPLEQVFDPTGAGDSFAGGFLGHLAAGGVVDVEHLRRAMVYGSAMGSFAVERFSAGRLKDLTVEEVHARVREFRRMTHFELAERAGEALGSGIR